MDMVTGCLRCTYCHSELTEELTEHSSGQNDTRSLMAKFNDQIEPIYALLRKVEDIRLSSDILEPEPTDYKPPRYVQLTSQLLFLFYSLKRLCIYTSLSVYKFASLFVHG